VECFHDRIRETVMADLPAAALAEWHDRLASALFASGRGELHEQIVEHLLGAGKREQAGRHAVEAAARAAETLAFDRAARLYKLALELAPPAGPGRHQLSVQLGDALANAGRGAEAARVYLDAAAGAGADLEALELKR